MTFRTRWFTLVELMIVVSIIWLLAFVLFPKLSAYYSRGRDAQRLANIKELSQNFQNYVVNNATYPSNTGTLATSYCISDIFTWPDAVASIAEKQYTKLGGVWRALKTDPVPGNQNIGICTLPGSYFYARLQYEAVDYAVLAARMELQTTGANYTWAMNLHLPAYVPDLLLAKPLDKEWDDTDRIYVLITN